MLPVRMCLFSFVSPSPLADGDNVLAVAKKLKAAPGEMEKITIKADKLAGVSGPVTVSLEVL